MRYLVLVSVLLTSTATNADQEFYNDYSMRDRLFPKMEKVVVKQTRPHMKVAYPVYKKKKSVTKTENEVADLVADKVRDKLGERWVDVALRIVRVESDFDPSTIGPRTSSGRAKGIFQVMPQTARDMGYDPSRLSELEYGIDAGIEHMSRCIESGVKTDNEMSRCHVSGVGGWKIRLNSGAESYRNDYVRRVAKADV